MNWACLMLEKVWILSMFLATKRQEGTQKIEKICAQKWLQKIYEYYFVVCEIHCEWGHEAKCENDFPASLNKKSTLREMHGKTYLFLDSDVSVIFDELLKLKIIDLHEVKCEKMMTYIIARIITLGVTLLKNDFPSRIERYD